MWCVASVAHGSETIKEHRWRVIVDKRLAWVWSVVDRHPLNKTATPFVGQPKYGRGRWGWCGGQKVRRREVVRGLVASLCHAEKCFVACRQSLDRVDKRERYLGQMGVLSQGITQYW